MIRDQIRALAAFRERQMDPRIEKEEVSSSAIDNIFPGRFSCAALSQSPPDLLIIVALRIAQLADRQ